MSSNRSTGHRRLVTRAILLVATVMFAFIFIPGINAGPGADRKETVIVRRGAGFREIVAKMEAAGVVRFQWPLLVAGTLFPELHKIKPGRYVVPGHLSSFALLKYLHTHPQDEVRLLIPNGMEQRKIAAILAANLDIDSTAFMEESRNPELLTELGIKGKNTEGYLFPGTYNFVWGSSPKEVITFLTGRFRAFYSESLRTAASRAGLSELELLTLASIVEAETPLDHEKPLIARVYLNRLSKGMRLQADPTVQYAIPGNARRLYFRDLEIQSPYNTYRHKGLPPGPICNPGPTAIRAVLDPASTEHLYFVATGDGGHAFATTLAGHARNIERYRAALRRDAATADPGSSSP